MPEPIRLPKLTVSPELEATIAEQERQLGPIRIMRDQIKALGDSTKDLDSYIELAETIIASSKAAIAKVKAL